MLTRFPSETGSDLRFADLFPIQTSPCFFMRVQHAASPHTAGKHFFRTEKTG
jgi:hypothetical protein